MIYLEHLSHTSDQELAQFGINSAVDLAKILKQVYHNLQHSDCLLYTSPSPRDRG